MSADSLLSRKSPQSFPDFCSTCKDVPSSLLCTPWEIYNVYCNLSTCGRWTQVSVHLDEAVRVHYLACWRGAVETDSEREQSGGENEAVSVVVPVSVATALTPARLRDLLSIRAPSVPPGSLASSGSRTPFQHSAEASVRQSDSAEHPVRMAFVEQNGMMVFTKAFANLKALPVKVPPAPQGG
eukprot:TRINITY_DN15056_c0_g1_i1.p1 TRINITY_DN15056_c0_g1~~TRINITY_DN15056_c0_g1_i1.p1  ORF type:complete len:183 (-),score=13.03 TRINITY_DN15056_c0_g1_i1:221-769(-)